MRKFLLATLAFILFLPSLSAAATRQDGIAAVVNAQAITRGDVNDRLRLVLRSSGMPDKPDVIARIKPQVLAVLIDEAIKTQEAKRLKIDIPAADIDAAFADIAAQNKMSADQFAAMMKKGGVNPKTLRAQIAAQLAWMKVVARKIRPQIVVSEPDIDRKIAQLRTDPKAPATFNREEVATRLGLERLEREQRYYLLDLKSASFIDVRDK